MMLLFKHLDNLNKAAVKIQAMARGNRRVESTQSVSMTSILVLLLLPHPRMSLLHIRAKLI